MPLAQSSYILTGAGTVTRSRDQLSFPFNAVPQAMTVYVRVIWLAGDAATAQRFFFSVGSITTAAPRFFMDITGSLYRLRHDNAFGAGVQSTLAVGGLSINDTLELRGILNSDGSVFLGVARNGAAESIGTTSAAQALATAWFSPNLMLNSAGTLLVNFCAYRNVLILRGVQSLAQMRKYAGVE